MQETDDTTPTRRRRVPQTEPTETPQTAGESTRREPLVARGGETLRIEYGRVTLQVGQYSPVEIGGIAATVTLKPGEDAGEVFDRWYGFLEERALTTGRAKLATFRAEYERAKARSTR